MGAGRAALLALATRERQKIKIATKSGENLMATCKCTNKDHREPRGHACDKPAITPGAYPIEHGGDIGGLVLTWLGLIDPTLSQERMRPGGQRPGARLILVPFVHWATAGLDRGRY